MVRLNYSYFAVYLNIRSVSKVAGRDHLLSGSSIPNCMKMGSGKVSVGIRQFVSYQI
jgi:hypothetical protein